VSRPAMGFVGVDTGHSSIMKVFPRRADHLGLPTRDLRGHDVPLGAPDAVYRDLVSAIRDDEGHLGALVTTHKIRVFEAARDLFDELDDVSVQCGEISSISKRDCASDARARIGCVTVCGPNVIPRRSASRASSHDIGL